MVEEVETHEGERENGPFVWQPGGSLSGKRIPVNNNTLLYYSRGTLIFHLAHNVSHRKGLAYPTRPAVSLVETLKLQRRHASLWLRDHGKKILHSKYSDMSITTG